MSDRPWADPDARGNKLRPNVKCIGCGKLGCVTHWGPWCFECNVPRMDRLDKSMEALRASLNLVERLREMAAAWERWGADGIFKGALHSDIVSEAAAEIERLTAALASEREACALVADYEAAHPGGGHPLHQGYWRASAEAIASAIRARGKEI